MSSVATDGHRCAMRRLALYARCDHVAVRRGSGWLAVVTGVASNDMNGVVATDPAGVDNHVVGDLIDWFQSRRVPASWYNVRPDEALTAALLERGAHPERTGWWTGAPIPTTTAYRKSPHNVAIRRVRDAADLDAWLDVAGACGWLDGDADRRARRRLYEAVGFDDDRLGHWIAVDGDRPAGMASSFLDGDVVDLCNLAVLAGDRRRGVGTALIDRRLGEAAAHGATRAVSAVSPEGWQVYQRRGFHSVPVRRDVCFYLPSDVD
jgi:ribosomal protein S18 acetylase RimI-like enzyme